MKAAVISGKRINAGFCGQMPEMLEDENAWSVRACEGRPMTGNREPPKRREIRNNPSPPPPKNFAAVPTLACCWTAAMDCCVAHWILRILGGAGPPKRFRDQGETLPSKLAYQITYNNPPTRVSAQGPNNCAPQRAEKVVPATAHPISHVSWSGIQPGLVQ